MAGIFIGAMMMAVPLYFFGERIRHYTSKKDASYLLVNIPIEIL